MYQYHDNNILCNYVMSSVRIGGDLEFIGFVLFKTFFLNPETIF